jgi:Domain of unknown function (DUF5658)
VKRSLKRGLFLFIKHVAFCNTFLVNFLFKYGYTSIVEKESAEMDRVFRIQKHLWICLCLGILNAADALFTHQLLQKGGKELNPLMRGLYEQDPVIFLLVKFFFSYLIIAIGFIPLKRRVQVLLLLALVVYVVVISWHLIINIYLMRS